jgi:outer membrane murein-binding lipoprotein Lpp
MTRTHLATLSLAVLAACSGGGKSSMAGADSLSRDLSRPEAPTTNAMNDRPAAAPAPKAAKPRPKAAAPTPRTLAAGTLIEAAISDSINSRHDKPGKTITAAVARDVKDRAGRVVIPAGSVVTMTVSELAPAKSKSAADGKLAFDVKSVNVRGRIYALDADVDPVAHELKGRGVSAGEVEKVGVGTAVGALGGRIIGGNTKGAVIGGIIGAGAGTAVAVQTASRDVIVRPGTPVKITLRGTLVASM